MAGQFTRLQKSYRIDANNVNPDTNKNEVPFYRGVVFAGENTAKLPTVDNQIPLGVVDNDERIDDPLRDGGSQAGRQIAVKLEGIASLELASAVSAGDRVYLAVGGKIKPVPSVANATPVEYNVIGFVEKSGVVGDVLPVRMQYHIVTK